MLSSLNLSCFFLQRISYLITVCFNFLCFYLYNKFLRTRFTFAIFVPLGFLDDVFVGFFVAAASSSGAVVGFALAVTDGVLVGFTVAVAFGVAVGCFVGFYCRSCRRLTLCFYGNII